MGGRVVGGWLVGWGGGWVVGRVVGLSGIARRAFVTRRIWRPLQLSAPQPAEAADNRAGRTEQRHFDCRLRTRGPECSCESGRGLACA